jgi:hypothetical protein
MTPLEILLCLVVVALLLAHGSVRERAARAETTVASLLTNSDEEVRAIVRDEVSMLLTPKGRSDA